MTKRPGIEDMQAHAPIAVPRTIVKIGDATVVED